MKRPTRATAPKNDEMKLLPIVLLLTLAACASRSPYATTIGRLRPGATMTVRVARADFSAFPPAVGQPRDRFTIASTALPKGTPPPPPRLRADAQGVIADAPDPLADLLVRVPDGVTLVVDSQRGHIEIANVPGPVRVRAQRGDVQVNVPGYAQAAVGVGNLSVTLGATTWPGTLVFSTVRGDIEVSVYTKAAFRVHLHTARGTLFTDFDLRGRSRGRAETIDGVVNGGGTQGIDIESESGSIRLLRLTPLT